MGNIYYAFMVTVFLVASFSASKVSKADVQTIEIFLSQKNKALLDNEAVKRAHEAGITLVYYYLDNLESLNDIINKNAQQLLQDSIDNAMADMGESGFAKLSGDGRTRIIIIDYKKHNGDVNKLKDTLFPKQLREKYRRAYQDTKYAQDHGIQMGDLPALLFDGNIYKKTLDLGKILDGAEDAK